MNDIISLLIAVLLLAASLAAYCMVVVIFFEHAVTRAQRSAALFPWRAFAVGVVNALFFGLLVLLFAGAADSTGIGWLGVLALIALGVVAIGVSAGAAALARMAGTRLLPGAGSLRQIAAGALLLTVASLLPVIGWFLLLPYLLCTAFGAAIMGKLAARRAPEPDDSEMP